MGSREKCHHHFSGGRIRRRYERHNEQCRIPTNTFYTGYRWFKSENGKENHLGGFNAKMLIFLGGVGKRCLDALDHVKIRCSLEKGMGEGPVYAGKNWHKVLKHQLPSTPLASARFAQKEMAIRVRHILTDAIIS